MPTDRWGIPFWYATKATAGITNSGHGFFWQQSNNALDDDGMIRFGKELEDVEIINESTGEWEFPFLPEGDGLSLSGSTGHHSGGENHGCQGFAYMCDSNLDDNPPTFRFRKEMYHVNYDTHSSGEWTNAAATGPCEGNWKGMGWVRYNKKDGISAGHDSVILEVWWNDDPDDDITNWVMLRRIEDKGGWGDGGDSCDGNDDQVGTWSNVQFRFKSAASDFSLHPLIRETNDDPDVHSIGGENMSFSDSEARGFGKRADMPRDIEMKCIFKWDGGGDGKCRFKNISLREIDPGLDFDSNPDSPGNQPPVNQPAVPQTIIGTFRLQRDINVQRSNPCAATGNKPFFEWISDAEEHNLALNLESSLIERLAERCVNQNSSLYQKVPSQFDVKLRKVGSPAASPTIRARIRSSSNALKYTSPTEIDPSSLTTSLATKTFDFSTNTYTIQTGDRICVEYDGTDEANYVQAGVRVHVPGEADDFNSTLSYFNGSWFNSQNRDLACIIYEA